MKAGSNVNGVWVEEYDSAAGTYTRRDKAGAVISQRPLTADEAAEFAAMDNEAAIRAALASTQFDGVRAVARGSGTFASEAIRDAAIRACARAIVALVRLQLRRLEAAD